MTVGPGTKLGAYEVVAAIGAGGMGEVYRARDSRLNRDVALKIIRQPLADAEHLARFRREAQALAALNHPHVASIYGLDEIGGTLFLVMELIPGQTLGDLLASRATRALDVTEALTIARQIAEALETAHDKNIVHRDLKPANIRVTPEGIVKVLDFGLAKALAGETSDVNLTNSPTLTVAATSASISTPVWATVSTEASISTASTATATRTSTSVNGSGWQRGMSSDVRLAAMTPATCAVTSASPFGSDSSMPEVSGAMFTVARAMARRLDIGFPPTSTMWTSPPSPTWVSPSAPSVTRRSYVQRFHVKTVCGQVRARREGRA